MSEEDRSFLARFGSVIVKGGIAPVPSALFHYQAELGLSPQQIWFIAFILSHKWNEDLPYPSLSRMAELSGVSRRQLQIYRKELTEKDYLIVNAVFAEDAGQLSNTYDFRGLFKAAEKLLKRDGVRPELAREGANPSSQGSAKSPSQGPAKRSSHKKNPSMILSEKQKNKGTVHTDPADFLDQGKYTHLIKH